MRRMITSKQGEYIGNLEKGVEPVATYPRFIESFGEINWATIQESVEGGDIDLNQHVINSGSEIYFNYPEVLAQYGLKDGGDPGYVALGFIKEANIPETINTIDQLRTWIYSEEFADLLNDMIGSSEADISDYGFASQSGTVSYMPEEPEAQFKNGILGLDVNLENENGEGQLVEGAINPQYNGVKSDYIQVTTVTADNFSANGIVTINGTVRFNNNAVTINQGPFTVAGEEVNILGCSFKPQYNGVVHQLGFEKCSLIQIKTLLSIVGDPTSSKKLTNLPLNIAGLGPKVDEKTGGQVSIYSPVDSALVYKYMSWDAAEVAAINAWAPQTLRIALKDDLFEAYGITNAKIVLGNNTYVFDSSDEEAFVLQGTWSNISTGYFSVEIKIVDKTEPIYFYNS